MTLTAQAARFFQDRPHLRFAVIGTRENLAAVELRPFGVEAEAIDIAQRPDLAEQYLATNQAAFGTIGLPRWVLSDLYLLPSVIGAFLCEARHVTEELRAQLKAAPDEHVIGAAYVGAPTLHPGMFIGVSLLSFLQERRAAAWVKSLTLKALRAQRVRGVAQWDSVSLRVHTRLGPLRLIGPPPGAHEYAERTFVYETDLGDEIAWAAAMARRTLDPPTSRIAATATTELQTVLARAATRKIEIVAPGIDEGRVLLRE